MLGRINSLLFPRLVHVKDAENFKSESSYVGIYRLDWSGMEKILKDKHDQKTRDKIKSLEDYDRKYPEGKTSDGIPVVRPQCPSNFYPALPPQYKKVCDSFQFALTPNHRKEIIRNARRALDERGLERNFDTMMRDICLEPASTHTYVAFRLLADCIYDPETNFFDRGPFKKIAPEIMLYRMWFHQTGWGLIWEKAGIPELERSLENISSEEAFSEQVRTKQFFVRAMNQHETNYKKHIGYPECNEDKIQEPKPDMKTVVDAAVSAMTDIYRSNDLVLHFQTHWFNNKMPFEIPKDVRSIAEVYTYNRRKDSLRDIPDVITEGTTVSLSQIPATIESIEFLCQSTVRWIGEKRKPYSLHLAIDEQSGHLGLALIDF